MMSASQAILRSVVAAADPVKAKFPVPGRLGVRSLPGQGTVPDRRALLPAPPPVSSVPAPPLPVPAPPPVRSPVSVVAGKRSW